MKMLIRHTLLALCLGAATAIAAEPAVLISNVTVIDGTGRAPQPGRTVLVQGDKIVAIRDHDIPTPGATKIDGRGKFLIPGLIDTHIHLQGGRGADRNPTVDVDTGRRFLHGFLYAGTTAVYDSANYDKFIFTMRDLERSGRMISPRIYATGYLLTRPKGYADGGGAATVDTFEQGTAALDRLIVQKPDLIKFILAPHTVGMVQEVPTFSPELFHRLLMYANSRGYRTTVHATEGPVQRQAVEAGIDALAHPVYMTATDNELAPMIAARNIPVSTTLVVLWNIFSLAEDSKHFDDPLYRAMLTPEDRVYFHDVEQQRYKTTTLGKWGKEAFQLASTNVRKLYDAGATLALGTDRTIGATVHQELELLVGLGIPPLQALKIGTLNAAKYLRQEDRMGSVEEGKLADLVLLDADPTTVIKNTRTISQVILGGKVVDRGALDLPINKR